jgi:aspartyl-tRNA(Asn)/glutamyl-tRNA(Gln) amidotransferase subunit B
MNSNKNYHPVIGLEIHVELKTKSKMFCQDSADYFGKKPNSLTCPVCLGLPGALPVPNKKAVEWTILIGKALGCKINKVSKFDRKHYFYPDLPKGYQISQYDEPIAVNGQVEINGREEATKTIRITRVHLEEDTAKLLHSGKDTLVDFNRSGVPLVEIVTDPDFDNPEDVKRFLEELQVIVRYLGVSDADMEKGSMRLEPNISVRVAGEKLPKYKVEVKNINSFNFVKRAVEYEIKRQTEILSEGKTPKQETRGYNPAKGKTYPQRKKEEAHDYRYFPEPDIPPMTFASTYLDGIQKGMPELPREKVERYVEDLSLRHQDAFILTRDKKLSEYFERITAGTKISPQDIANLIINKKLDTALTVDDFIKEAEKKLKPKVTDTKLLEEAAKKAIEENQRAVDEYKKGKENAIMFLVGKVMREMKGQADAKLVIRKLKKMLK